MTKQPDSQCKMPRIEPPRENTESEPAEPAVQPDTTVAVVPEVRDLRATLQRAEQSGMGSLPPFIAECFMASQEKLCVFFLLYAFSHSCWDFDSCCSTQHDEVSTITRAGLTVGPLGCDQRTCEMGKGCDHQIRATIKAPFGFQILSRTKPSIRKHRVTTPPC